MRRLASRVVGAAIAAVVGVTVLGTATAGAANDCEPDGCVRAVEVSGLIDPVVARFILDTVRQAEATPGTRAIMLELNSTGEVLDDPEFNELARVLRDSRVPVSAWVGPAGADALGGAAELAVVLGDVSAAPGSKIGEVGRQRLDRDEFGDIASGDRAAIADTALEAEAAQSAGVIDRVAPTANSHLIGIDVVTVVDVVDDAGTTVKQPKTTLVISKLPLADQLLHTVASPAVAYLMLAVGLGLLIFEFFTAGVGVAGIIGAGATLGAGYGLAALPVRPWAVALCVLAAIVVCFDIAVGVPRLWTAIGLAMWVVGSLFLFTRVGQPWIALAVGIVGMSVAMVSGMPSMVRSRFGTPTIGREHLIGALGRATSEIAPDGSVEIDGAPWRAMTNRLTPVADGDEVRVVAIDGLTLEVEPLVGGARDYREMRSRGSGDADVSEQ